MPRRAALGLLAIVTGCAMPSPATWSPAPATPSAPTAGSESTWIAYQHPDGGIRLVRSDGSDDRALDASGATSAHPDWSPDGSRIAYVADDADSRDIYTVGIDGSGARRVFDCQAPCVDADGVAWSPDGRSLAFRIFDEVDGRFPGSRLAILDIASGATEVVAATEAPEYIGNGTPVRWSPDGRSVVMDIQTIERAGTTDEATTQSSIAILDLDDSTRSLRRITDRDDLPRYVDWSGTGERIVFMAGSAEAPELFTISPDGLDAAQLTTSGSGPHPWGPTWSPDGATVSVTMLTPDWTLGSITADDGASRIVPGPIVGAHPRLRPGS